MDKRDYMLMDEYREKADKMDGQGRVRTKLEEFGDLMGLVVGRFNEVSNDVKNLIESMAGNRAALVARREGRHLSDQEKGLVVGQLRRQLSTVSIRAGSCCLLDRMHQCGPGASLVAKRREVSHHMEGVMRQEGEVQWLAKLQGGQLFQKGRFLVEE